MNPSISASLALTADGARLRVQAAIVGAAGRTFELLAPTVERAIGCSRDGTSLLVTGPEATLVYEVDEPRRYLSVDGTVLRLTHSDLQPSWKLAALLPTPIGLDERYDLEIDLPVGFRVVASNAEPTDRDGLWWKDTTRLDPYLVASNVVLPRFTASALVGGREVSIVSLGEDLTEEARGILGDLGRILGPPSTPRVVIDVTSTLPAMEYRGFVRTNLANLRHELAHQWFGTTTRTARPSDLWIDEAAVMLLTEPTRTEIEGFVPGLGSSPSGCVPRMAYHYGADTLRRSFGSTEDTVRMLRAVVDGGVCSTEAIREHVEPARREWFDRRISGDPATEGAGKGPTVTNDIAGFVFGLSPLAAMASSAAQILDGPLMVFDELGVKKAVAYRFATGALKHREFWALASGFTLGPASAAAAMTECSFDVPNNQPTADTWTAFQTWANSQFAGTKDWFDHEVTTR